MPANFWAMKSPRDEEICQKQLEVLQHIKSFDLSNDKIDEERLASDLKQELYLSEYD